MYYEINILVHYARYYVIYYEMLKMPPIESHLEHRVIDHVIPHIIHYVLRDQYISVLREVLRDLLRDVQDATHLQRSSLNGLPSPDKKTSRNLLGISTQLIYNK